MNYSYNTLKKWIIIVGVLLFIQYWLGMVINLFAMLPNTSGLNFSSYSGGFEVLAHIGNAFLILIISSIIILYSLKLTQSLFSKLSILATLFIVSAILTGFVFILGGLGNSFSIAMAMIFISTYSLYFYEFYLVNKAQTST
jgi:hypothetical protein